MIKYLSKTNKKKFEGVAIVRLDFNTEDDWRLRASLPTLKFLIKAKAKILILSHRGRPLEKLKIKKAIGKNLDKFSLRKDARVLARLLGRKVIFIPHFGFSETKLILNQAPKGSVFLLENLRFLESEEKNDMKLGRDLALLGDYYINDAFAVSHRANASVVAITKFLPSYGGLGLEAEILNLSQVMKNPKRPLVLIVGGGKAKDKVGILKYFKNKADKIILGGGAANTLLFLKGFSIGDSIADRADKKDFAPILKYKNIVLPMDFRMSNKKILDIGEKTAVLFGQAISQAKTIIWNGPLGLIEDKRFDDGTIAIARAIGKNRRAYSLAGGGETVMFLKKYKLDKNFSFISTGGGAMLEFLAGEKLPGIEALK